MYNEEFTRLAETRLARNSLNYLQHLNLPSNSLSKEILLRYGRVRKEIEHEFYRVP